MGCKVIKRKGDKYDGPNFTHTIQKKYEFLQWRNEKFPGQYPDITFTLEWWKENWREVFYEHFPEIEWFEEKPKKTVERKRNLRMLNAGRKVQPVYVGEVLYPGGAFEVAEKLDLPLSTVRQRITATSDTWKGWRKA